MQTAPAARSLVRDLVALVEAARAVRRLDLAVEVGQRRREPRREPVFLVQADRLLNRGVADGVPVREVLCDDARARLVFLRDVVPVFVFGVPAAAAAAAGGAAGDVVEGLGGFDVDGGGAELGLVEEEGGFCGSKGWFG